MVAEHAPWSPCREAWTRVGGAPMPLIAPACAAVGSVIAFEAVRSVSRMRCISPRARSSSTPAPGRRRPGTGGGVACASASRPLRGRVPPRGLGPSAAAQALGLAVALPPCDAPDDDDDERGVRRHRCQSDKAGERVVAFPAERDASAALPCGGGGAARSGYVTSRSVAACPGAPTRAAYARTRARRHAGPPVPG
jgi:hypothetical protein